MDLTRLTIQQTLEGYRKKTFKPTEVVQAYLKAVNVRNKDLNAFLQVIPEWVLQNAGALEKRFADIEKLPLYGIPIAIKDAFLVKGWQATSASKILQGYVAPYTATCVQKLIAAGAIVIGKTNLDEFAMGSSTENSGYGVTRNPWDLERVPGGSSGGSAVAVSAGLCLGSLGTDTGGSIRQPASLCGVVGLKPTYGRVSRFGIIAFASSLDQAGPFAKNCWDTARVLEVMAGQDRFDATSSSLAVPRYSDSLSKAGIKKLKVGIPEDLLKEGLDEDVKRSFNQALDQMKKEGAEMVKISLPHAKYAISVYYLIAPSEASSNLARFDGIHYGHRSKAREGDLYAKSRGEGFGKEVKLRIMIGTYALSAGYYDAYYRRANQVRELIRQDFSEAFKKCDVIATPTSPTTAFKIGEKTDDPLKMYLSDCFTVPASLAGLPGISLPSGVNAQRLPIGMQLIGRHFEEERLLGVGHAYEKLRGEFPECPLLGKGSH